MFSKIKEKLGFKSKEETTTTCPEKCDEKNCCEGTTCSADTKCCKDK
ncbi:MAG: hypothetical protein ACRC4M_04685 [Mycoplasma sp.]